MTTSQARTLSAPLRVSFDYTRSVGPTLGAFFAGLRERRLVAGRLADGSVVLPPPEFDPATHEPVTDFVEVGPAGTVQSWTWVPEPVAEQPFDRPFAWALVLLDGATAPFLHALDIPYDDLRVGMRVRARWVNEPVGAITDIACFEKLRDQEDPPRDAAGDPPTHGRLITPVNLDYTYAASPEESAFFRGLEQGRILGQRCPACGKVYVPPRGACPVDGVPTTDEVELPGTGTVTTFCIVNVPFLGQKITPPYVSAYVLLDGADIAFLHLILGIEASEVRMGMRVEAVWRPRDEWGTTVENISHFAPTDEPDADFESYKVHL
ncbi:MULTISPECIES: Zn-ribbon domain-containing OB-fold protein [unclassified Nocardioides]|uniref:Zn-ribbon domain-containing OB-fold protein n=1 Tax=unclassified Nocardioides TaxID=2615069 RepID=UPI0006FFC8AC|nr:MULTISPECIES: OB-fold nucleic acid binding domain-containing protein [unclassified Nocardioides]KQY64322.1 DNA-binding protein [Nocardioides sp. Root140]KRF16338.1 DNA-binding protein [Nocardioides sp. Soil796]